MQTTPKNCLEALRRIGYTYAQLAEMFNLSKVTLIRVLRGETSVSWETGEAIIKETKDIADKRQAEFENLFGGAK